MNEFINVVTKKYADFSGRAPRREYWMYMLWYVILIVALAIVFGVIGAALMRDGSGFGLGNAVIGLVSLALILPSLAVAVRRLHDTGRSGWWWLISFIPFGSIVLLVFMVLESQPGDNLYGPNPKGVDAPGYTSPSPAV